MRFRKLGVCLMETERLISIRTPLPTSNTMPDMDEINAAIDDYAYDMWYLSVQQEYCHPISKKDMIFITDASDTGYTLYVTNDYERLVSMGFAFHPNYGFIKTSKSLAYRIRRLPFDVKAEISQFVPARLACVNPFKMALKSPS